MVYDPWFHVGSLILTDVRRIADDEVVGGGWRVEGGRWRVEGGGLKVENINVLEVDVDTEVVCVVAGYL